eukprot:CAMPEP_0172647358 /NCGR_PEP_ID=MMETSP1068-20121228/240712_1 /TAXON_ID=35684 /ORGANISM="Pseudopedinella elastica, Strain CCMP716" /LENGTH=356 /DNA_ID=CAMNT_0013461635 /DNA_START=103 /DNA_END=1173 /DNA_ORIENTATION=-
MFMPTRRLASILLATILLDASEGLQRAACFRVGSRGNSASGPWCPAGRYPRPNTQLSRLQQPLASSAAGALLEGTPGTAVSKGTYEPGVSVPPGPFSVKLAGRNLNLVGLYFMVTSFASAIVVYPFLTAAWLWSLVFDRKRQRGVDWIIHVWAKLSMLSCFYAPKVTGLENLPKNTGEAFLLVPNHTSFLDIYSISGFIPIRLKYVSKVEILRVPLIGWAMRMARHIAIRRTDRKSQLETFKDTVASLKAGNNVVTFAEGTRSPDGTLKQFKKGPFKMSKKAGVRIIPVSICDLWRWMPPSAILPLGYPRQVEIKIHPPVETAGRDESEVERETFAAINSGLPEFQQSTKRPACPA